MAQTSWGFTRASLRNARQSAASFRPLSQAAPGPAPARQPGSSNNATERPASSGQRTRANRSLLRSDNFTGTNPRRRSSRASGRSSRWRTLADAGFDASSHSIAWVVTGALSPSDLRPVASNRRSRPMKPKSISRAPQSPSFLAQSSVHACCSARSPALPIRNLTGWPVARSVAARIIDGTSLERDVARQG
jgi:hypothetical protein